MMLLKSDDKNTVSKQQMSGYVMDFPIRDGRRRDTTKPS